MFPSRLVQFLDRLKDGGSDAFWKKERKRSPHYNRQKALEYQRTRSVYGTGNSPNDPVDTNSSATVGTKSEPVGLENLESKGDRSGSCKQVTPRSAQVVSKALATKSAWPCRRLRTSKLFKKSQWLLDQR